MMKKNWIALLTTIICVGWLIPAQIQAEEPVVIQSVVDCMTGMEAHYFYDEEARVIRKTDNQGNCEIYSYYTNGTLKSSLQYSENKPVRFARFDTYGNKQLIQTWGTDNTIRYQRYSNTYDEQGRLLEVRHTNSMGMELQDLSVLTYIYYENNEGYMTEFHVYHSETDQSPYHTRFTYYDNEGRLLGDENYDLATGEGICIGNLYDEWGNKISHTMTDIRTDWQETLYSSYNNEYNDAGALIRQECETTTTYSVYDELSNTWKDDTTTNFSCYHYQYDAEGRTVLEEIYDESNVLTCSYTWEYDKYGNLLKHSISDYPSEEYQYTYAPLSDALLKNN